MGQHKKYFGTDGIRGRVGQSHINPEFMLKLGWAVGRVLGKDHAAEVVIGKDTRLSGYMIESALEAGLSSAGVSVKLLGPMPTPGIAYLTRSLGCSAGIVISASHNPFEDNGIKLFDGEGFKLSDALEREIESHIDLPMQIVSSEQLGKAMRIDDARERYMDFCKKTFPDHLSLNGLRIVLDCANGAGYYVAPRIFEALGATVIAIANTPDGFNINQACGSTDVDFMKQRVQEERADLGIALDGDGDRVIMVDHKGEPVDGDQLLCILALDGSRESPQGIVGTVMTNLGLEQALGERGIPFERAPVGDRHVLAYLRKKGWSLGGEGSGHIVNLDHTTTGDGIIAALQVLSVMQASQKTLHDIKQVMPKHPQVLINVPVSKAADLRTCPVIDAALHEADEMLQGQGRVLLRPSGTEPVVRVMVEGHDAKLIQKVAEVLALAVQKAVS